MACRALAPSLALAVALATPAAAQQMGGGAPPKSPAFERLKSLEGSSDREGGLGRGGTETMYHLDGGQLVLTHYCAAGNQPHMKLEDSKDPGLLSFRCAGGGNMTETDMHMHAARITIVDADHIKGTWSSAKGGKPAGKSSFALTRKK